MNKFASRKFIIAVLLIIATLFLAYTAMHLIPVTLLVGVMPAILGFAGVVLGAVAVMYPVTNVFANSKWSNSNE